MQFALLNVFFSIRYTNLSKTITSKTTSNTSTMIISLVSGWLGESPLIKLKTHMGIRHELRFLILKFLYASVRNNTIFFWSDLCVTRLPCRLQGCVSPDSIGYRVWPGISQIGCVSGDRWCRARRSCNHGRVSPSRMPSPAPATRLVNYCF